MTKMKPKVKALWINALKSGRYKQGRNFLRNSDNTFCCLGVLCDIYAKTQKKKGWSRKSTDPPGTIFRFGNIGSVETAGLPKNVQKWSGVKSALGYYYLTPNNHEALSSDNDAKKKTFAEIAEIIEQNF